jgi:hypothetical protein
MTYAFIQQTIDNGRLHFTSTSTYFSDTTLQTVDCHLSTRNG